LKQTGVIGPQQVACKHYRDNTSVRGEQYNPNEETRGPAQQMTSRGATQSKATDALGIKEI